MKNRILTNKDRKKYKKLIEDMYITIPDMMSRKIPEANVQQAFAVDMVKSYYSENKSILCVGDYEDTAYEYLKATGYNVVGISPEHNYDLHTFITKVNQKFDIIFSVSVIEHVKDDIQFINDICKLLNPSGVLIIIMDFNNNYGTAVKTPKPSVDCRLYTQKDYTRLVDVLDKYSCVLVDEFSVDAEPDFEYEGCKYSFSTLVAKKVK